MKTLKELFYEHHIEVGSEVSRVLQKVCAEYIEGIFEDCVNAEKLPEEIKAKARDYVEKRDASFRAFGVTREDVTRAWLEGFAFCLAGTVDLKVVQCSKPDLPPVRDLD